MGLLERLGVENGEGVIVDMGMEWGWNGKRKEGENSKNRSRKSRLCFAVLC